MICPICHKEIKDGSKFCGKCGNKIPRCPSCGEVIYKRTRYCVHDGAMLPEELLKLLPEETKVMTESKEAPKKKRTVGKIVLRIILTIVVFIMLVAVGVGGYIAVGGVPAFVTEYFNPDDADTETDSYENDTIEIEESTHITYICGKNPCDTSVDIAELLKTIWNIDEFDNMILVDETGTSAAFSASYLSKQKQAPVLLVDQEDLTDMTAYIKENLCQDGTLYLLGSMNVIADEISSIFPDCTTVVIYGENRYETNTKILQETDIYNREILVCRDTDYGIGISASATGRPVLLVKDELTEEQKQLLSDNSCEIILVGNGQEFDKKLKTELESYDKTLEHIGGGNVCEISVNIAKRFFTLPDSVMLVSDLNYANSLCAGALAMEFNSPIVVFGESQLQYVKEYIQENEINTGYYFDVKNSMVGISDLFIYEIE